MGLPWEKPPVNLNCPRYLDTLLAASLLVADTVITGQRISDESETDTTDIRRSELNSLPSPKYHPDLGGVGDLLVFSSSPPFNPNSLLASQSPSSSLYKYIGAPFTVFSCL